MEGKLRFDPLPATMFNGFGCVPGARRLEVAARPLEASEEFEMGLPDPVTGACPGGGVPIDRVFNQRIGANHRYTTGIAIRDQRVARGGIAEGYGPGAVTLCGLALAMSSIGRLS